MRGVQDDPCAAQEHPGVLAEAGKSIRVTPVIHMRKKKGSLVQRNAAAFQRGDGARLVGQSADRAKLPSGWVLFWVV